MMRHWLPGRKALGAAAGAAAVVLVSAACGGGTADGSGPAEGMQRIESGWLSVDVPAGWKKTDESTELWTEIYQDASGEDATVQLAIAPEYGRFDAGMSIARAMAQLQVDGRADFERLENLPSSDDEVRSRDNIAYSYTADDGKDYEGVILAASDQEEHGVLVQVTGQDLDEALLEQIDSSLVVRAGDA